MSAAPRLRALLLATYYPHPGNELMGTWALEQAAALARAGVEIQVVSLTPWVPGALARHPRLGYLARCPARARLGGVDALYPRWPFYRDLPARRLFRAAPDVFLEAALAAVWSELRAAVTAFAPDVVIAHHTLRSGYVAARIKERLGIPFLVVDHDISEIVEAGAAPGPRRVFERVYAEAATVVAVSRAMEAAMRLHFPGAPTAVVHNGTDAHLRPCPSAPRPPELAGRTVVTSVGMMYERKGFPILIEAFSRLTQRFPDALLRIVGDGPDRRLVERAVAAHGVRDRVVLVGAQPHAGALQEIAWADVFALVGWEEPFGVVFLEAMALGKPVVVARDAGVCELVEDGRHVLAVEPRRVDAAAAALARLLADHALRRRLGDAGRALVERELGWDQRAAELYALARQAATGRAVTPADARPREG